jgi:hypothetical protein
MAKARGCSISLLLRNPTDQGTESDKVYNIDRVIQLLSEERNPSEVVPGEDKDTLPGRQPTAKGPDGAPAPAAKQETVKVRVATEDIKAGTDLTADLLSEKFKDMDLPKELAEGAITEPEKHLGKVLKNGLAKGQWLTTSLLGDQPFKSSPQDQDSQGKPGPVTAVDPPKPPKKPTHDVSVYTPHGTKVFRYEETKPGEWRLLGEVPPTVDEGPKPEGKTEKKFD